VVPFTEKLRTGHQFYWQGAGAFRIRDFKAASLYVELPVAVVPSQKMTVGGVPAGHLISVFVTPSFKAKLFPKAPVSAFATLGGGWARYDFNSRITNKGALQFGGGLEIKTLIPHTALRFEVRDFVSGEPNLFLPGQPGFHRHNVLAGGGPVFTF
jgi:hypothetical protein